MDGGIDFWKIGKAVTLGQRLTTHVGYFGSMDTLHISGPLLQSANWGDGDIQEGMRELSSVESSLKTYCSGLWEPDMGSTEQFMIPEEDRKPWSGWRQVRIYS